MSILSVRQSGLLGDSNLGLDSVIDIARPLISQDSMAGEVRGSPIPLYTGLACSIQEAKPQEVVDFGQRQIKMSHSIWYRRPANYPHIPQLGDVVTDQNNLVYVVNWTMDFQGKSPMVRLIVLYRGAIVATA